MRVHAFSIYGFISEVKRVVVLCCFYIDYGRWTCLLFVGTPDRDGVAPHFPENLPLSNVNNNDPVDFLKHVMSVTNFSIFLVRRFKQTIASVIQEIENK